MASKTSTSVTIRGVEEGTGGLTREMEGYPTSGQRAVLPAAGWDARPLSTRLGG